MSRHCKRGMRVRRENGVEVACVVSRFCFLHGHNSLQVLLMSGPFFEGSCEGVIAKTVAGWRVMKRFDVLEVPVRAEFQRFDGTVRFVVQEVPQGQFAVRLSLDSGNQHSSSKTSILLDATCTPVIKRSTLVVRTQGASRSVHGHIIEHLS